MRKPLCIFGTVNCKWLCSRSSAIGILAVTWRCIAKGNTCICINITVLHCEFILYENGFSDVPVSVTAAFQSIRCLHSCHPDRSSWPTQWFTNVRALLYSQICECRCRWNGPICSGLWPAVFCPHPTVIPLMV